MITSSGSVRGRQPSDLERNCEYSE